MNLSNNENIHKNQASILNKRENHRRSDKVGLVLTNHWLLEFQQFHSNHLNFISQNMQVSNIYRFSKYNQINSKIVF